MRTRERSHGWSFFPERRRGAVRASFSDGEWREVDTGGALLSDVKYAAATCDRGPLVHRAGGFGEESRVWAVWSRLQVTR